MVNAETIKHTVRHCVINYYKLRLKVDFHGILQAACE